MKSLIFVFTMALFSQPLFADSLDARSDSGIYGPKYDEILQELVDLHAAYPDITEIYDYGTSMGGRTLRMLIVAKPYVLTKNRPTFQITGSIHGNEYLAIEDKLPRELLSQANKPGPAHEFINQGGVLLFVPIVNPDGYERRRRYNNDGADLNRDWDVKPAGHEAFKQTESTALADALDMLIERDSLELKITVDYHCCAGALLLPWSYTSKPLPEPTLENHRELSAVAETTLDIDGGTTAEILGYYATGTTKDYYHSKYGSLSFTYEGRYKKEDSYLEEHVDWWEKILRAHNRGGIRYPMQACKNVPPDFTKAY